MTAPRRGCGVGCATQFLLYLAASIVFVPVAARFDYRFNPFLPAAIGFALVSAGGAFFGIRAGHRLSIKTGDPDYRIKAVNTYGTWLLLSLLIAWMLRFGPFA